WAAAAQSAPAGVHIGSRTAVCSPLNDQRICGTRKNSHDRPVTEFSSGLNLVIKALEQIRDGSDRAPRASVSAVAMLREARLAYVAEIVPKSPLRQAGSASGRLTKAEKLAALAAPVSICTKCPHLARSRTQTVFG